MIDKARLDRFLDLTLQKKELKAQIKEIDEELTPLTMGLPDEFIEEELESMRFRGHTLYMATTNFARAKDGDDLLLRDALMDHDFGSMVKANTRSLTSLVKEFDESDEGRPEWLDRVIDTTPTTKLVARKSK